MKKNLPVNPATKKVIDFINAWQSSNTSKEVAAKLKVSSGVVRQYKHRVTAKGVKLKNLSHNQAIDWDYIRKNCK